MVKEMKVIDIIQQYSADNVVVVRACDTIDTLWGLDFIKLIDTDIKALKEGKCLYTNNGEYAQLICYEAEKNDDFGDYPDTIKDQFDNMTGSMNL